MRVLGSRGVPGEGMGAQNQGCAVGGCVWQSRARWHWAGLCPPAVSCPELIPLPAAAVPCSKLPSWARAVTPRIFYITEKAWNYYPYTITGEPWAGCGDG